MSDSYLGEVRMVAFSYAPPNWALCNGQLLRIADYPSLYSLLGTRYGGDGASTFGVPNLKGAVPVHAGPGYVQGQAGGAAAVALTANQCGQHTHAVTASTAASTNLAAGGFPAPAGTNVYGTGTSDTVMNPAAIAQAGAGAPHNNLQPYLVINFVISLSGLFPQRN